jgi:hypothetical protein
MYGLDNAFLSLLSCKLYEDISYIVLLNIWSPKSQEYSLNISQDIFISKRYSLNIVAEFEKLSKPGTYRSRYYKEMYIIFEESIL